LAAGPPSSADGKTVLVVEDEPSVRNLVIDVLHERGYATREAADGQTGLQILQGQSKIDLLVSDVGLPGLNGRQLADAARAQRPDLPILFMTGYAENAAIAGGFLAPGMEMITKPFAVDVFIGRVASILKDDEAG
jgi:CheY-like chemotaxis protein